MVEFVELPKNLKVVGYVEMCLKIDVEVWKNLGTFAGQRGTILGVFLLGCH